MTLGVGIGYRHVLDHLKHLLAENPDFYYATQGNEEFAPTNIFWADAASRANYSCFGDAITFDTSFHIHQCKIPFASFTGMNHHGQPVLFGCALLFNESDAAYVWLFQTWLQAMSGRLPISIMTEPDRYVQMAVAQVLPATRHRYCMWSIFRETEDNLAIVYQSYPTFETEFRKCVNESERIEEFESRWESLLGHYCLTDNEWLRSMHTARHQWVPVYMRDAFFGELSSTKRIDGRNSYFYGFIDATTTVEVLIERYEKAVASWHEKELKADDDTTKTTPALRTSSPMEKQAANIYTRKTFMKFQEELVESLANSATEIEDSGAIITFHVAKSGAENKAHIVKLNSVERNAMCSCQMFEFSGVICGHILTVFRAKNILRLPAQYILHRWSRKAKIVAGMDHNTLSVAGNARESSTLRYNNLRQEAMKFVEEGAKSVHAYKFAMTAMMEAAKKLNAEKDQADEARHGSIMANGGTHSHGRIEPKPSQSTEEKIKKIQELRAELERTNQQSRVYQTSLLEVLKDIEGHKLILSMKVQDARLALGE